MNFTISRKLFLLIVVAMAAGVAMLAAQLVSMRATIWRDRQDLLQSQVASALSVMAFYDKEAKAGRLPEAEAKQRAHDAVQSMRYANNDYFFAFAPDGTRVLHADSKLEGKSAWDEQDQSGAFYIRTLIQNAKGGGFTTYYRSRPGATEILPKLSYTQMFEPWQWAVGTGVYVDDLETAFRSELYKALGLGVAVLALLCAAALPIARSISRPVAGLTQVMRRLSSGDLGVEVPALGRRDEIGAMASAVQVFKEAGLEKRRL
ncbi:cache domain-containing protein, partial [Aureimonas endophytica]|uniref:cache domain-containing protein n=1 Tax=Aureimonas endophytica TaxID=2027858 RepID=UPI001663AC5E